MDGKKKRGSRRKRGKAGNKTRSNGVNDELVEGSRRGKVQVEFRVDTKIQDIMATGIGWLCLDTTGRGIADDQTITP